MSEKSKAEILAEELLNSKKNPQQKVDEAVFDEAEKFCVGYKKYLDASKTEREAVTAAIEIAEKAGFKPFDRNAKYIAGDKVYVNNRGKAVTFAVIGKKSVVEGTRILAAHIDSPRLDLKPAPLYEAEELALFKTHYYGGVRKYQWTAIPLALHGVVCLKDGSVIDVCIGEDESDPCFCITDLLPHLAADQSKRTLAEGIRGEELNILIGSRPLKSDSGSELVKLNIIKILNERYGIVEADFWSAELQAVPAARARDVGFDRSMIGAYGHDDKVCAYPALAAITAIEIPEYTAVVCLADKEEIGSEGNTGLNSRYLANFVADLAEMQGGSGRAALSESKCLSADVNAAYDPTFPDAFERRNSCFLGRGVCLTKYTGSRGKGGSNDASAEFVAECRNLFDSSDVIWQTGELGKVDQGGGGTVAKFIASYDVDVVDIGVPVLSMHAPYEVISKFDVYMAFKAFKSFIK